MKTIVPTITAEDPHTYRSQIERVQSIAIRLHIDLMDGIFTPNKSIDTSLVWWPEIVKADIHLMFQKPETELQTLIKLKPQMVIIPAESDCDIPSFSKKLNEVGIKCGVALLAETSVESVKGILDEIQHLLIFSGNLGHQGGSIADLKLLQKVEQAKTINPNLEIAWDGGVNESNITVIAQAGVDIINVGGFIHAAPDPVVAYNTLNALLA